MAKGNNSKLCKIYLHTGFETIAQALVEKGASVNTKNFRGDTALSLASARGTRLLYATEIFVYSDF